MGDGMQQKSSDPPSELNLQPGGSSSFRIGGGGSVGYQWTWTIDGDADAISVAIEPASPPPTPTPGVLFGGSVDHIVVVRGVKEGMARLNLVLARPKPPSRGPLASYTIDIKVSATSGP
jgi:hypothetical protein